MSIGKRIRAKRDGLRMSRAKLAQRIGISVTALQKIEEDKTRTPRNLEKIANILGVEAAWLQFGTSSTGYGSLVLSTDETTLLSRFRQLNQDERNFVSKCIAGLIKETYK